MRRSCGVLLVVWSMLVICSSTSFGQNEWSIGGRLGLARFNSSGTVAGLKPGFNGYNNFGTFSTIITQSEVSSSSLYVLIGATAEYTFDGKYGIGSAVDIYPTDRVFADWTTHFRYYFPLNNVNLVPFAQSGFAMQFASGGPYFGLRFGGGLGIRVANKITLPIEVNMGPMFYSGTTEFPFAFSGGVAYIL